MDKRKRTSLIEQMTEELQVENLTQKLTKQIELTIKEQFREIFQSASFSDIELAKVKLELQKKEEQLNKLIDSLEPLSHPNRLKVENITISDVLEGDNEVRIASFDAYVNRHIEKQQQNTEQKINNEDILIIN